MQQSHNRLGSPFMLQSSVWSESRAGGQLRLPFSGSELPWRPCHGLVLPHTQPSSWKAQVSREAEASRGRCCSSAAAFICPAARVGGRGVLQIPKQRLADRQTDVESSKLETKVGTTTSVWPGPPTPIFRPRRVKTQKLQICKRWPLSVPEMQSHSTQARKTKLPSDGNAGRVCKSPDVKRRHSAWWVAPTGATRLGGGAGPSIAGIAPGRRRT